LKKRNTAKQDICSKKKNIITKDGTHISPQPYRQKNNRNTSQILVGNTSPTKLKESKKRIDAIHYYGYEIS
jgi:hypothetical protein